MNVQSGAVWGLIFALSGLGAITQAEEVMEANCVHSATSFHCVEFDKNHDGDTLTVNIPGVHPLIGDRIEVRVDGIDTAEIITEDLCEKRMAEKARDALKELLTNARRIDLLNVGRDKYFRILADVRVDGESVKDRMLRSRLAVPYDGGTKTKVDWCHR